MNRTGFAPKMGSRTLFLATMIVAAAGCKVTSSGLPPFGGGGGGGGGGGATSGSAASNEEVRPIENTCDTEYRSPEAIADGVPPAPCEFIDGGDPVFRRRNFVRPKVAAAPGRPTVGRVRPPWCASVNVEGSAGAQVLITYIDAGLAGESAFFDSASNAAVAMCVDPDYPRAQDVASAYIQLWVNATGASPQAVSDWLATMADDDKHDEEIQATCKRWDNLSNESDRDRDLQGLVASLFSCPGPGVRAPIWHLDREGNPPVLMTMARLQQCARGDDINIQFLTAWAACRPEVALLSAAKLDAELTGGNFNASARASLKLDFETLQARIAMLDTELEKQAGSDPALRAVLIDAPAKAWAEWQAGYQAHRAEVDAARAYEEVWFGNSKSAKRGCLAKAQASFASYVRSKPWQSVDEMAALATDPIGGILAEYLRQCLVAEGDAQGEAMITALIASGMPRRGPRFAVAIGMRAALAEVMSDRERFAIQPDFLDIPMGGDVVGSGFSYRMRADYSGVVSKVEPKGDRVIVSFKAERWSEDERECIETNKIIGWRPDGTPMYRQNCRYTGKKVQRESQAYAFHLPKELAGGIKPGVFVEYSTGSEYTDKIFNGVAVHVWADNQKKKLVAAYGVLAP